MHLRQPCPSRRAAEVKRQVRIPSVAPWFGKTFVACAPSCDSAGVINQPASGHYSDHLDPRALCSERVIVSLSSPLLRPDPPISAAPPDFPSTLVIQEAVARRPGLGRRRDLPCFGSALLPRVPSPLRREEKQVHIPMSPCSHRLPQPSIESAPPMSPTSASVGAHLATLVTVFACYGPRGCSPSWTDPTWSLRPGRRGLSTRAFPRRGRPPRESGIATRHLGRTP